MDEPKYIKIAKVGDFAKISVKSFRVLTRYVGIFREPDGSFRAMEVGCRHQGTDLTQGQMRGDVVTCPWHGWRYNLRTGECLWGSPVPLRPYGLRIDGDDILITMKPLESEGYG